MSKIEWTGKTWNPLRGCDKVSPGCKHCYAERQAARPILSGPGRPYEGLVRFGKAGPQWTGQSAGPDGLDAPLRWRKGQRIFVCSMSDLFFEGHSFESIAAVFGVMAACPQHTFQVLTKRPARALEWFAWADGVDIAGLTCDALAREGFTETGCGSAFDPDEWPLPNVQIGVSVESQRYADERIPLLLEIPAALCWLSCEPLLEAVDLRPWLGDQGGRAGHCHDIDGERWHAPGTCPGAAANCDGKCCGRGIDWVIVGGESGPGARPFDLGWARSLRDQCAAAGVPYFFKQAGARPYQRRGDVSWSRGAGSPDDQLYQRLRDKKGGDPAEWPADLRVRQWPEVRHD